MVNWVLKFLAKGIAVTQPPSTVATGQGASMARADFSRETKIHILT